MIRVHRDTSGAAFSIRALGATATVAALLLCVTPAHAQWVAVLTPTVNPLAIGGCGPVRLALTDPATKDWPRNPTGNTVALSDFDLTVAGVDPTGVAGEYNGPSIWSACACQGATVGSAATVTATYPAASLAPKKRVPGVAFKTTATFTIAAPRGAYEPTSCSVLKSQTVASAGSASTAGGATATAPITVGTPATGPVPPPTTPPLVAGPPMGATRPGGLAGPVAPTAPSAPAGPTVPGGVRAAPGGLNGTPRVASGSSTSRMALTGVTITPTIPGVRVSWANGAEPGSNVASIDLIRADGSKPGVKVQTFDLNRIDQYCNYNQNTGMFCDVAWFPDDVIPDNTLQYTFTIIASYTDGTQAASPPTKWTFPVLSNPGGFTAQDMGGGNVAFNWQPMAGAMRYRLDGPGLPNTGMMVSGTTATIPSVPGGPGAWQLVAMYPSNFADFKNPSRVSQLVRLLPNHSIPWLSKRNGPGADTIARNHYKSLCNRLNYATGANNGCSPDLDWEVQNVAGMVNASGAYFYEAVYGNTADLGFGRRTSCAEGLAPPPGGQTTICVSSSHGPAPGQPNFGDPTTITNAANQNASINTTTVITKDATGMRFLVFGPPGGNAGYASGQYGVGVAPSHYILLDAEGQKFAPHVCLSCHGGSYDPNLRRVLGASFLPLNPWMFAYAGGSSGRATQEESIRRINNVVARSGPTAAIAQYINGLYNGAVAQSGAKAVDDFVPPGWSAQAGLYKQVVRPYCATCHLAAQPAYSFASFGNFQSNAALIHAAVCTSHSMPHAELQYKEFWTKNTGALYLPGLLAASLGYSSC